VAANQACQEEPALAVDGKVHTACAKADGIFFSQNSAGLLDDITITYSNVS
jgi:hypothetical protein